MVDASKFAKARLIIHPKKTGWKLDSEYEDFLKSKKLNEPASEKEIQDSKAEAEMQMIHDKKLWSDEKRNLAKAVDELEGE